MSNPVEQWKQEKHGFDVWPDVLRYAEQNVPMKVIDTADLERMKWHGVFYRKRDAPGNYMLRIRLTACELTALQAKEIAYVAYELGHGIIDVTTRANLQVQGLAIDKIPQAISRLEACGLTTKQTGHDNIRNVFCHPLSGLTSSELIDTRSLCHEIAELFIDSRIYSDLPRKFNIAVSGAPEHAVHYWTQDISFLATGSPQGEVLFQLLIAGTQGQHPQLGRHLPVLVEPEQVVEVTRTLLDLFRERGSREKRDRARFRYLVDEIGIHGVLSYLEDHLSFPLRPCPSQPQPSAGYEELVGWHQQKDPGYWSMGLCIPLGRLSWMQLEGLARLSKKWGDGTLRTTHEQGLIVSSVRSGFRDAAATDAAALGLSVQADTLLRNTVACTGKQFCNIAVTETKGQMLRLIERLRQRALTLHGIRIHMSGCPASCAQHHTADIGLKGVRVRRLIGTREGFDVYLGGGVSGQLHLGFPYRLGVDIDQLPQLIEEVVQQYYLKHRPGQTFSAYWREILAQLQASAASDGDYCPPIWLCESCHYRHLGEDPPVFCPSCAALRRSFARLEDEEAPGQEAPVPQAPAMAPDGFVFAIDNQSLSSSSGASVEIGGQLYAIFRVGDRVVAMDGTCPHEGAPLGEGTIGDGVVTCPWHSWTFSACNGCSIDPPGHQLRLYETKVDAGKVFIKIPSVEQSEQRPEVAPVLAKQLKKLQTASTTAKPVQAELRILAIVHESSDTKTFRFDNSQALIPVHKPGQFAKVCVELDGQQHWRSFTISSSPTRPEQLDLTVKLNTAGVVSSYLHSQLRVGDTVLLKAPQGAFYFDLQQHSEPLVLISAGSGITPMMSILRYLCDKRADHACTFIYGVRTLEDILFVDECLELNQRMLNLHYHVQLTQPPAAWQGPVGRIDFRCVQELVGDLPATRFFLCGPGGFMDTLRDQLAAAGVPLEQIHTEQFHRTAKVQVPI